MGFLELRYSVPINVGANQSYKFPIEYICEALDVESFFYGKILQKLYERQGSAFSVKPIFNILQKGIFSSISVGSSVWSNIVLGKVSKYALMTTKNITKIFREKKS